MPPPRRPVSRSHIHRAEDIYSPGEGDQPSLGEVGLGSGVTVDNQSDPPASVSTLVVPGATLDNGTADLSSISGVQRVRRVELTVAYDDTPDYTVNSIDFFKVADLANGVWVVMARIHKLTPFDSSDVGVNGWLQIDDDANNVGEAIGPRYELQSADFVYGATDAYPVTGSGHPGQPNSGTSETLGNSDNVVVRGEGLSLWVVLPHWSDPPTEGLIRAYALIAEPAS